MVTEAGKAEPAPRPLRPGGGGAPPAPKADAQNGGSGAANGNEPGAHPLQHKWVLWYDNAKLKGKDESWEDNLKRIFEFDSVEAFWGLFNNVMAPSMLSMGSNYHVFKDGIKPMWEDEANREGGKFVLTVRQPEMGNLDEWWTHAVLAAIGEILEGEGGDEVCGLVLSLRPRQHRIALWTRSAEEGKAVPAAKRLKEALKLPGHLKLSFQMHDESIKTLSSFQNTSHFEV